MYLRTIILTERSITQPQESKQTVNFSSEQSPNINNKQNDKHSNDDPETYPHHYDFHTALSLGLCSAIEEDLDVLSLTSVENANLLEAKLDSDLESDGSSFSYSSGTDNTAESDSDVDDAIAMESIDEINTQNRICSTIEDYDDGELVFSEADLKIWKKRKKLSCNDTKKGITGANKSTLTCTRSFLPYTNLM